MTLTNNELRLKLLAIKENSDLITESLDGYMVERDKDEAQYAALAITCIVEDLLREINPDFETDETVRDMKLRVARDDSGDDDEESAIYERSA